MFPPRRLNTSGFSRRKGHLEFFICDAEELVDGPDGVVTQRCFNRHPLSRATDDGRPSPIDFHHKGRYFVDPPCVAEETDQTIIPGAQDGNVVTAHYHLPDGLTCERCIVQMVYCESLLMTWGTCLEFNGLKERAEIVAV